MGILLYNSNNSGGRWWLNDEQWENLEDNGWVVHWYHDWNNQGRKTYYQRVPIVSGYNEDFV